MLELRNVTKIFGKVPGEQVEALKNVDFHVNPGELVTVVGPSGCGKTTLLRAIAGFEIPDSGSISVAGRAVAAPQIRTVAAHERGIGLVPQEGALFPHLSVAQNVGFGLTGITRRERRMRIEEALDLVGLAHLGRRRPHELSGGQQQRVALARALAPGPQIVLLDEPFSALDEYLRESLRTEVRELLAGLGTTAILVTHDQEEALALGDRVAVMRDGEVVQVGKPKETYFQPLDLELARFLGEAVVVGGEARKDTHIGCTGAATCMATGAPVCSGAASVSCVFGTLPVASWHGQAGLCDVLIRPENIQVLPADDTSRPGLIGTIREHTFYGHDGVLRIDVPELAEQISVRVLGDHEYDVGNQVRLVVDRPVTTYSS